MVRLLGLLASYSESFSLLCPSFLPAVLLMTLGLESYTTFPVVSLKLQKDLLYPLTTGHNSVVIVISYI